ncbi:MAG: hypothetical protein A4E32_00502 [Methanomassiliicoccales archaeon PtaU1.Bin124]|nr:MAG: hypothetical protein A4E32_00502 [Methanomassiliicoccales archaeon PtaU1.Bin124]
MKGETVIISCVIFEVASVVEPAIFLRATRLHLIRPMDRPGTRNFRSYHEFHNEVRKQLAERLPDCEVLSYPAKTHNFTEMLRLVLGLLKKEKELDNGRKEILVNITAGSPEYSAAATMASMMIPDVKPFNTSVFEFTVDGDRVREVFYEGDRPIGLAKKVNDPTPIPVYKVDMPSEDIIEGLKIFKECNKKTDRNVIKNLENTIYWKYSSQTDQDTNKKEKSKQAKTMYYRRNFKEKWFANGWITDDGKLLTKLGEDAVATFYHKPPEPEKISKENMAN